MAPHAPAGLAVTFLLLVVALLTAAHAADAPVPAIDQLRAAEAPHFRPGHTLPPLTRWGWSMPYEVRVELCERWGYALEFGGYVTAKSLEALDKPDSVESKLVALTNSDPKRYPLSVLTIHGDFGQVPQEAYAIDKDGNLIDGKKVWSPEAPDSIFQDAAARWSEPVRKLRERVPIAMVLNGGEYALSVYGFGLKAWEQDPRVVAARGDRDWYAYISERKAHQEIIISQAFRDAVPDRTLYLYYPTESCPQMNSYGTWWHWTYDYKDMRPISDIPNTSIYYLHFNTGWSGTSDMLTQALNSTGHQIAAGEPLSYNWLCAGWVRPNLGDRAISERARYMGYLKCYYTGGMIGGCAGYFSYPKPEDPNWLWQMMDLGHVHALFSHLEDYLRKGDLIAGPDRHRWSKEIAAYELPTGDDTARVVGRRMRDEPKWLLTAWAATGDAREVTVTVPELGQVRLNARPCGSVYTATLQDGKPALLLLDADGMNPTKDL